MKNICMFKNVVCTLGLFASFASAAPSDLVDAYWQRSQLTEFRSQAKIDVCLQKDRRGNSFGKTIEAAVRVSLDSKKIYSNSAIQRAFGLPTRENSHPVSLMSHPVCEQGRNQVVHMLGESYVPDAETMNYILDFAKESNRDRKSALRGSEKAKERFVERWTVLMGCIAYAESLDISDPSQEFKADDSFAVAMDHQPNVHPFFMDRVSREVSRPRGVWFGADRNGSYYLERAKAKNEGRLSESVQNALDKRYPTWPVVGLFQFNASRKGNIDPCVRQWNDLVNQKRACRINSSSDDQLLMSFASHGQSVNSYCGVQKIVQSFNSQVNTINTTGTDLSNLSSRSRLLNPRSRCVSLVSRAGRGRVYSHFGPLRNSVKYNLKKVMKCTQQALRR